MVRSRTVTALAGLGFGLAVSIAAWAYLETLLLFVFLPFVPFLFGDRTAGTDRSRPVRECPQCSFRTTDPAFEYCPRDGHRLREPRDR